MSSREPFDEPDGLDGPDEPDESGVPAELSVPGGLDALEAELLALGDELDVPAPPPADVAAAVRARLAAAPPAPAPRAPAPHAPVRRRTRWKVVAAVVIAVVAITAATPQGRAAVVRVLRFAGVEFQIGDTPPPPVRTTAPIPGEHPADTTPFPVRTPEALGAPERTTVADHGRVVSMFWPGGVRLDQFDGTLDPVFFKKLGPPWPDYVKVAGRTAWWIPGAHPLGYLTREDGTELPLRQAEPTLVWQQGTTGYRLEGLRTSDEAVRVAESLE